MSFCLNAYQLVKWNIEELQGKEVVYYYYPPVTWFTSIRGILIDFKKPAYGEEYEDERVIVKILKEDGSLIKRDVFHSGQQLISIIEII